MYRAPNLNGKRYRRKRIGLLNIKTINKFKEKNPAYKNINPEKLKSIIKIFNGRIWNNIIENRNGVELPESLGFIFIGTCSPSKKNVNIKLSTQYDKPIINRNWETDGNIAKIFYTNFSAKYKFINRDLWGFTAVRNFKRTLAKYYPENWNKYVFVNPKQKVNKLISK